MKNIKKIILFSLFGALSIGCASLMVGKANNAKVASADGGNGAAWHIRITGKHTIKADKDPSINLVKTSKNSITQKSVSSGSINYGSYATVFEYDSVCCPDYLYADLDGTPCKNIWGGTLAYFETEVFYLGSSNLTKKETLAKIDAMSVDKKKNKNEGSYNFTTKIYSYKLNNELVKNKESLPTCFDIADENLVLPNIFGNTFIDYDGIEKTFTLPSEPIDDYAGSSFAGYFDTNYDQYFNKEGTAVKTTNLNVNNKELKALFTYSNINFGDCTFNLPSDASNQLKYLVDKKSYFVGVETVLPTADMMVKSGYRFKHWEDNNGNVVKVIPASANSSSTFTAVWEDTTYDVNFYSKDVLLPELSFQYEFGETHNFTTLDDTPFEHFEYWKDESGNRKDGIVPSDARDFNLYAYWTARNYNVKLNTNGADSCKELTSYVAGTKTDLPGSSDITKKGFNFVGWYENESLTGTPISFISDTQTGDVEYWAKWSGIEYSVSFVTYTQGEVISAKTFIAGIGISAKDMPVPTRDGYSFVGWFAKEYDTDVQPSSSDRNYSETGIGINNPDDFTNIILYAKWNLDLSNNGAFRFICYGHLGTKVDSNYNATVEVKYGDNVILKTFTAKNVSNCTSIKNPESMLLDFTTTFLPSEITFVWEGKSIGRNTHSVVEIYYQSDYQPVSVLEKEKYIISDSNVRCTVNPSDSSSVPHSTITFSNQNTTGDISGLSFDVPNGSSMPTLLNKDYLMKDGTIGQYSFTKPSLVDSKGTNLELQGFYDANANNKYFDADLNPVADAKASDSMTLYPGFLQDVNYIDGATTSPSTYLAGLNNTITFAPAYTKENAEFTGWSYTENGEVVTTIDNTKKDELNLYSIWSYYVYFDSDGGSSVDPQLVAQTQTATKPTDPTKEVEGIRYQFLGWYLNADLYDFATPVTESITLKAKWVSYVDVFVTTYMHPEIDPSNPGTGSCITEGWYANAKAAFAELNDAEKTAFTSDIEYAVYYERFVAWARANGETFDGINIVQITSFNPLIYSENSGTVLVIILSIIFVSALLAGFVIVRKKKQY